MFSEFLLCSAVAILVYVTIAYCYALYKKDNSLVDILWGLGFILVTFVCLYNSYMHTPLDYVVSFLVFVWGLRLAFHIFKRHKKEDWRYAKWRKEWGKTWKWRSYLQVFLLQGVILLIVASTVIYIISTYTPVIPKLAWLGVVVWIVGFFFEVVADYQVRVFKSKKKNKGKILMSGLWKYSRHPNYFGEAVMWWGIWIIAYSVGGWFTIVSPLLLTYLLRYVSGVTMLERKYKGNKAYAKYAKKTNAMIPWFPR